MGSLERAIVSSSAIFFTTSSGFVMRSPEASFFYNEEVRVECVSVLDSLRCAESVFESNVRLLSKQPE